MPVYCLELPGCDTGSGNPAEPNRLSELKTWSESLERQRQLAVIGGNIGEEGVAQREARDL